MDATVVDLRYKMAEVIKALDRCEEVRVLYHGKVKGRIIPEGQAGMDVVAHPFFGSQAGLDGQESVDERMVRLRGGRFRDL